MRGGGAEKRGSQLVHEVSSRRLGKEGKDGGVVRVCRQKDNVWRRRTEAVHQEWV